MSMFKKDSSSTFIICVMFSFVLALIIMSVFASEVNANEYTEPELVVPALEATDEYPVDTYEDRTIFEGIAPWEYIPVNFDINTNISGATDHYYNSEYYHNLSGKDISVLNNLLNDYDPFIDTFKGIYDPTTKQILSAFPMHGEGGDQIPQQLTLLLDRNSYFAEGLTLDVEEWWERIATGYSENGDAVTYSETREFGLDTTQQEQAIITHGFGLDIENQVRVGSEFTGWTGSITLSYEYSDQRQFAFSRTYHTANTETKTYEFGLPGGNAYKWAVYQLVTQTKVNYSDGHNFDELDDAFRDEDDYGLRPDMNSYIIKMVNQKTINSSRPIYPVDTGLAVPNILENTSDVNNLTTTLTWRSAADAPNVEGILVYKNDSLAATILDKTVTSWTDVNVEPGINNTYYIKFFYSSNLNYGQTEYFVVSLPSNTVIEGIDLTSPATVLDIVVGCSIPMEWTDNQIPAGERTYYNVYLGDPALGGTLLGEFEGTNVSININSGLYDLLLANPNEDFYISKTVIYNGAETTSPAVMAPNNFTVTDTAFLFSSTGFNGDCVTVAKDDYVKQNLNSTAYNFDDQLSSMLIQGDVYVRLFPDLNGGGDPQTFFSEDGYAFFDDLNDHIIRQNTVSSVQVAGIPSNGHVYVFNGPHYTGAMESFADDDFSFIGDVSVMGFNGERFPNDALSSVKVIGDYALILHEHSDFTGKVTVIKEDHGSSELIDHGLDNKVSSVRVLGGRGAYFFNDFDFRGSFINIDTRLACANIGACNTGLSNDRLSSVLTIGTRGVTLYEHNHYGGKVQAIRHKDNNLGSSGNVGDNTTSSFKVFGKGVYFFTHADYDVDGGFVKVKTPGDYTSVESVGINDNSVSSIFVVDMKVTLFQGFNLEGTSEEFINNYDPDLTDNTIGNDRLSSFKLEEM
ncbi:hypothetical protein [Chengkuizengella sediminis]|uniref:hypothetical protein n=1 Tax=Chengkuizengella sediminis TaxID=1885917 RepID=UPI001389C486|nr:hypothetical protein [Chengkuizengella sediminis]NDI35838.1 hypothetical protein [Chengkuizengella sediminis]